MTTSALRYHLQVDLRDKNTSQTQLALLTGPNKKVLEVGPATGYLTEVLVRQGCRVTAIEKDQAAAEMAAKFCERMIVSDVDEFDFAAAFGDERFDVVMFGDVLEHLVRPQSVLSQVAGLLHPKGYVVASVPNIAHGSIRLALLNGEFRYTEMGLLDRTHLGFYTKESLQSLFREAEYVIRTWRRTTVDAFATELQLREADYPPHLVASLRNDPLALTYQFVVKAYPAKRHTNHRTSDPVPSDRSATEVLKALWQREEQFAEKDAALAERDTELANNDAALADRNAALAEKDAALAVKDAALAERESLLARSEESLDHVTQELIGIRQSLGYRMLEGYRRPIRWLFPPGSWRSLPYRAMRRTVRLLLDLRRSPRSVIRRALKARRRYGTKALIGKSITHLVSDASQQLDPIRYALAVNWRAHQHPQLITGQPLDIDSPSVNWVIPTLGEGGGHRTIFRFIEHLAERGYRQRIYEMPVGGPPRSGHELRSLIRQYYGLSMADAYSEFEDMAPSDVTFATSWHTAYPVAKFAETRKKLYFVQDFEPFFAPVGTESVLAENTYRFGFHGITAGRWLCEKLTGDFAMECDYFNLAVDWQTYFPKTVAERKKIVFYARPATPRRGFELGVGALEIFHSRNPGYEIVFVGGDLAEENFGFPMTNVGYVNEQELNELYNVSAAALVVSLTNCSLLPLEIMATGCPVVTTLGDNNELVLPPDSAILAVPSPHHLAEALEDAAVNPPPRERLIEQASQFRWENETAKIEAVLKRLLKDSA